MTNEPDTPGRTRPSGRAAVMDAVLDSATELIAERGPRAVTVRAIAQHAGVNHALVHRYFGSKDELITAVITREVSYFTELSYAGGDASETFARMLAALSTRERYVRFLTRAILDGFRTNQLKPDFLLFGRTLALMQGHEGVADIERTAADVRIAATTLGALALGWRIFGDFLVAGMGLTDVPRDELDARIDRFITAAMTGRPTTLTEEADGS